METILRVWYDQVSRSGRRINTSVQPDDIELLRFLKTSRASVSTSEPYKHVNDFCNVAGGTSLAAIHRALQKDMNDGKWTWKKLTYPVAEKFSPENLNHFQEFVNYICTSCIQLCKYKHPADYSCSSWLTTFMLRGLIRYNQVTTNNVNVFEHNYTESMSSHFLKIKPITLKFRVTLHASLRRIFFAATCR